MDASNQTHYKRSRGRNTIIATLHIFVYGLEFQAIVISLLYYLQTNVPVKNSNFYYGVIMAASIISASLSGVIFGKYVDRTRNVKFILLLNVALSVIGNLLYTVSYNVWFLVVGRFMNGFTESIQPIMCGEFNRVYSEDELGGVISRYQIFFDIGLTIGPATSSLFKGVDINIIDGVWAITQYNAIGLTLAILHLVVGLLILFGFKNFERSSCDKEDTHVYNGDDNMTGIGDNIENKSTDEIEPEITQMSCKDLFQIDVFSLIVSTSLAEAGCSILEVILNMTANTTFGWSLKEISIVSIIAMIPPYFFIGFALYKKLFEGPFKMYVTYIACLLIQSAMLAVATIPYFVTISSFWVQAVYFATLNGLTWFIYFCLMSIAKLLLFNIVPSHSSSFADGVRTALSLGLTIYGYAFASFVFFNGDYIFPPLVFILLMFCVILITRWRVYYYKRID